MTPEQLALSEAIETAGGQSELARKLTASSGKEVKQQQVWNWLNREKDRPLSNLSTLRALLVSQKKDCVLMYSKNLQIQPVK